MTGTVCIVNSAENWYSSKFRSHLESILQQYVSLSQSVQSCMYTCII